MCIIDAQPCRTLIRTCRGMRLSGLLAKISRIGTRMLIRLRWNTHLGHGGKDTPRNPESRAGASSSGGTYAGQQAEKRQAKPDLPTTWKAHNSKGVEICRTWNLSPNGCEHSCPQQRAHQCAICLSTHRACQHDAERGGGGEGGKSTGRGGGQGGGPKKRARKAKKAGK